MRDVPDYRRLDDSGEAASAAERMESRARHPSSSAMFEALVRPHLRSGVRSMLEVGCGSAGWARKLAQALPATQVFATDLSAGMVAAAGKILASDPAPNVTLGTWNVLDPEAFPFAERRFDLIFSSVMIPYLSDDETERVIAALAKRLMPGGRLVLLEQDYPSESVSFPDFQLLRRIIPKYHRPLKQTLNLGLRPALRGAGLAVEQRTSFLWTDDSYGPYTQEVLTRYGQAAEADGRVSPAERNQWETTLAALARAGDFYYGLVYHAVVGAV